MGQRIPKKFEKPLGTSIIISVVIAFIMFSLGIFYVINDRIVLGVIQFALGNILLIHNIYSAIEWNKIHSRKVIMSKLSDAIKSKGGRNK